MTVRISAEPFMSVDGFKYEPLHIGPAWVTFLGDVIHVDADLDDALMEFLHVARSMTEPGRYSYGTVYATRLDGAGRKEGSWHYDLGEYTHEGTERFVSTWRSDGREIGNVFSLPSGEMLSAPNRYVTSFHEGSDYHCHPAVPAVEGAYGYFISASFYKHGEPANLDCPRLAALRDRGHYATLARFHKPIARTSY